MRVKIDFNKYLPKKEDYERAKEALDYIIPILEKTLNIYDVYIGGSYAKGTWLGKDIDIFVRFPKQLRGKNISQYVKETLDRYKVNYILLHGSRDYFRVNYKGLILEIVPILKIDSPEEREIITDVSPFHVEYVKQRIKGLEDDAKKLKIFMKVINVYGAESYIGGFSGYSCELLTIYYKGFENVLKNSLNWKPKVFIDLEKYYTDLNEAIKALGKDKTRSPIILVDPVDKTRNALASLNYKNFARFILNAYLYLKEGVVLVNSPLEVAKQFDLPLLEVYLNIDEEKEDILGAKLTKKARQIINAIERENISVLFYSIDVEEKRIYLVLSGFELPKKVKHIGPPIWTRNATKFIEKYAFLEALEDGRVYTIRDNRYRNVVELVEYFIKNYLKDIREFKIKIIKE